MAQRHLSRATYLQATSSGLARVPLHPLARWAQMLLDPLVILFLSDGIVSLSGAQARPFARAPTATRITSHQRGAYKLTRSRLSVAFHPGPHFIPPSSVAVSPRPVSASPPPRPPTRTGEERQRERHTHPPASPEPARARGRERERERETWGLSVREEEQRRSGSEMNVFRLAGDMTHLLSVVVLLLKIHTIKSCAGWVAGLVQTLLYADFFYYYIMSWKNNVKLELPA
nr:unnamed protein product [Digitaria exilis]